MTDFNSHGLVLAASLLLAACAIAPVPPPAPVSLPAPPALPTPTATFNQSKWEMLPDWQTLDLSPSLPALLQSCRVLKDRPHWQEICSRAVQLSPADSNALRTFYENWFTPYQVRNPDGSDQGMITGYYEPKLFGSRNRSARFCHPLYAVPGDMLTIDLGEQYPQIKDLRLRGRLIGRRVVPYYNRAEIDAGAKSFKALFWVDSALDLFFLQVEGSGRIELPDGRLVKVGYADQNGHPYVSIGRKLVEMGELRLEDASMQGIRNWAKNNQDKLPALLEQNPSYVFFRELTGKSPAALGALGVPLTEQFSLAVDARIIPLGTPVFLSTTYPDDNAALNRLMLAQDTGGAIKGAVRADFFWGFGESAANRAGKMKQRGRMWVLFPTGAKPPQSVVSF
ncbi:MAG: MltA domain-containing protein [Proteobacteria bacterium]|nr:MltA domain-containing protein [Pseudomonadota bacterium]